MKTKHCLQKNRYRLIGLIFAAVFFKAQPVLASNPTDVSLAKLTDLPYIGYTSPSAYQSIDRKLYFFGGLMQDPYGFIDTIRVFDLQSLSWTELSYKMPYPIADAATGISINDHFYVTPGFTTGEYNGWGSHNKLIDVDLSRETAQETVTVPYGGAIWDLLSCGANGKVYIFGGHNGTDKTGIFEYVPGDASMSLVANMNYAHRVGAVTMGNDGWMYIMGQSSQIERFNPTTRSVEVMNSTLPEPFIGFNQISPVWKMQNENAIYFALGGYFSPVTNPPIYKFDYNNDVITDTGLLLEGQIATGVVFNVGIRDDLNPFVAYIFKMNENPDGPLELYRATLIFPCDCPDTDDDGVPDSWDNCNNTPAGSYVDRYGCPAPACDINNDGKIGLEEAIHALQVTTGIKP